MRRKISEWQRGDHSVLKVRAQVRLFRKSESTRRWRSSPLRAVADRGAAMEHPDEKSAAGERGRL
jgi:hypothetical protein